MRYGRCSCCDSTENLNAVGNRTLCDWCLLAEHDARKAIIEDNNNVTKEVTHA